MKLRTKDGKFIGRITMIEASSLREMAPIYTMSCFDKEENREGDLTFPRHSMAGRITLGGNPSSDLTEEDMTEPWCLWFGDVLVSTDCGAMFEGYYPTLEQLKENREFTFYAKGIVNAS